MTDENLGNSFMCMVDALVTIEQDYCDIETGLLDAALRIVLIAWNAEVHREPSLRYVRLCWGQIRSMTRVGATYSRHESGTDHYGADTKTDLFS